MKKRYPLIFCILVFAFMIGISAKAGDSKTFSLYLDISFKENLLFDKYDVDLFVDDQQIGTLEYASAFTKLIEVAGSNHTITFYKASNHECSGEAEIEIAKDSTYRATIQTDSKKIRIVSGEILETLEGSAIEIGDLSLMLLPAAIGQLDEQGLKNVKYKGADGEKIKKESNWIVLSQSVDPGSILDQNDEVLLTCRKITDFLSEQFTGQAVPAAIKTAEDLQYEISFEDFLTGRDLRNVFAAEKDADLDHWTVQNAVPVESNQKVAVLSVLFDGNTKVPDVTGMSLSNAVSELKMARIGNYRGTTAEGKEIDADEGDSWKVVAQSRPGGTEIEAEELILLSCEAYKELSKITYYEIIPQDVKNEETEKPTETEAEPVTEAAQEKTAEKDTEEETEKPTEKITEKGTEKETEIITEKATEKATEKETGKAEEQEANAEEETEKKKQKKQKKQKEQDTAENENLTVESAVLLASGGDVPDPEEDTEAEKTTYTATANLNVRSQPSTDSSILGKYSAYDQVDVYKIENGWAQVDYNGTEAFVSAQYIQEGIIMPLVTPETSAPETSASRSTPQTEAQPREEMVWISGSGSKYHSRSSCSNMNNPWQVTRSQAEAMGRTPCKKCY